MKAVLLTKHGGPEVLRLGEAPDPKAGSGRESGIHNHNRFGFSRIESCLLRR